MAFAPVEWMSLRFATFEPAARIGVLTAEAATMPAAPASIVLRDALEVGVSGVIGMALLKKNRIGGS
jgi:hypothetical protein